MNFSRTHLELSPVYLNAEPTIDWLTADADEFGRLNDSGPRASFDDPLTADCLLSFLSDFRSAHHEPPESGENLEATGTGHHSTSGKPAPQAFIDDPYLGSPERPGDDWWLASDGRWYPPELHPDLHLEAAAEPLGPALDEEHYPPADGTPEGVAGKSRRPRLRGLLRSPAAA